MITVPVLQFEQYFATMQSHISVGYRVKVRAVIALK